MKNQKGITLIALVITIIVLLILAGITIAMLTGENGLLTRAKGSSATNAVAGVQEEISLEFQDKIAGYLEAKYTPNKATPTVDMETVVKAVTGEDTVTTEFTYKGCSVVVDKSNNKVTIMSPADASDTSKADSYIIGTIDSDLKLGWGNE